MKTVVSIVVGVIILIIGYLVLKQFKLEKFDYFIISSMIGSFSTILGIAASEYYAKYKS